MSPIRVLFPFEGSTLGGSHISALELVRNLNRDRFEPVVALHKKGLLEDYLEAKKIEYTELPSVAIPSIHDSKLSNILSLVKSISPLRKYLGQNRIDIVHTHDSRMQLMWLMPCKLSKARHLWHQRTPATFSLKHFSRFADQVVTISNYTKTSFPTQIGEKTKVIFNPFEDYFKKTALDETRKEFRQKILQELKGRESRKDKNPLIIGFVSNFIERKRPLFFLDLAEELHKKYGDRIIFPMFGDLRDMEDKVRNKIHDAGIEKNCLLMGSQFPIEPWLCAFDIFIAPAVREGFGRTLVEAMYCDVPVIAANDGGHKEIIETQKTGRLVPPDDLSAFSHAAEQLLDDETLRKSIAKTAGQVARERFSVAAHTDQISSIYEELSSKSSSSS